jgi:molecular chaperone GrpE (heat shock protein)
MPRHHHYDRQLQEEEEEEARSSIIGQDLQINEADLAAIQDTEDYEKMLTTMRNYRNRIQEICEWMQKECSDTVSE